MPSICAFDLLLSRFGVMFFDNPITAFARISAKRRLQVEDGLRVLAGSP